ncbi:MAG: hypothetical protein IJT83_00315 [Victivallales bacterium]|nr:hypothetical protein [Victivallales bacterium]
MYAKSKLVTVVAVLSLFVVGVIEAVPPDVEITFPVPSSSLPVIINDSGNWKGLITANEVGFSDFQRRNSCWEQIGANINSEMILSKDDDYAPVITASGINQVTCKYYVGWFGFADLILDGVRFSTSPWVTDKQIKKAPPRILVDMDLVGRRLTVAEWGVGGPMPITPPQILLGGDVVSQSFLFIGNLSMATGLTLDVINAASLFSDVCMASGALPLTIASIVADIIGIAASELRSAHLSSTVDFGPYFYKNEPGVIPRGTDLWEARGKYEIEESSVLLTMYVDTDRDGFVPDGKQFNYCHPSVLTGGCRKIFYVKVIPLELQEE